MTTWQTQQAMHCGMSVPSRLVVNAESPALACLRLTEVSKVSAVIIVRGNTCHVFAFARHCHDLNVFPSEGGHR